MATELDRLFVTLEADLTNYQAGLKRAGVDLDTFTRDTERKTGAAGKAIGDGMAKAGTSVGMMNQQFTQLGYQLNDIGTSLASGASPFQVLAQQGGQVYQALAMNGGVGQGLTNVKNLLVEGATASRIMMTGLQYVSLDTHVGTDDQAASPILRRLPWWSATDTLAGCAYTAALHVAPEERFFKKIYPSGTYPEHRVVIRGSLVRNINDPAQTSAPSTWQWSDNPTLCIRDHITHVIVVQ